MQANPRPLQLSEVPDPRPGEKELLIRVLCCAVCHTELDEIEGRTPPPRLPVILGHQAVGEVINKGDKAHLYQMGERVGVAWIFSACGQCHYCNTGQENLCADFTATGRDVNGGYAQLMVVPEDFAFTIPQAFSAAEAAPLLCAGAIGYRSLMLSGVSDGDLLGLTGFGASAHLVLKIVRHRFPRAKVYVFARKPEEREFAMQLGAVWAGDTDAIAPELLHSIIDTTPAWNPVVHALRNLAPGGRLVINAIRKQDDDKNKLVNMSYHRDLWQEKEIKSVANVCRRDVREFLDLAAEIPIKPELQLFTLEQANDALLQLKTSKVRGAKVLQIAN